MSTSFMALKRWMNLMPVLVFLVAAYGTAVSVELGALASVLSDPAAATPLKGYSLRPNEAVRAPGDFAVRPDGQLQHVSPPARITREAEPSVSSIPVHPPRPPKAVRPGPAAPLDYPKVKVVATGYTAGIESTGKRPGHPAYGITYSGVKVRRDHVSTIAADPKVFPIGTLLYIPGYGYGVVADTGSKIKGHKIDLYFESKRDVFRNWGKKTVHVHVLRKGEGKLKESWLRKLNSVIATGNKIPASYFEA